MHINRLSLADYISIGRILLLYPLVISLVNQHMYTSFIIILIILISDFLDGFLAKKLGFRSPWGSIIDGASDTLIVLTVLFTLCWIGNISWLFLMLFITRMIILALLLNGFRKHKILHQAKSINSGKISHVSMMVMILYSIILPTNAAIEIIMLLLLSLSLFDYISKYHQMIKNK